MKEDAPKDRKNQTNSIHASLRQLLALGLSKSSSAEPQKITELPLLLLEGGRL